MKRKLKSIFIIFPALLAGMLLFSACSSQMSAPGAVTSSVDKTRSDTTFIADEAGFTFLPESKVKARSVHDQDSLWLELMISDTVTLHSLLVNGVSIWIDPKAKKNEDYGISFPAARSEMLRKLEAGKSFVPESADTNMREPLFDPRPWVEALKERNAVMKDKNGTRFAEPKNARLFIDDNGNLNYQISISFAQLGISEDDHQRVSIGVISQLHQAQLAAPQGGGGVATRPNLTERERQQRSQPQRPTRRLRLIPVETWMVFLIHEEYNEQSEDAGNPAQDDDIYFRNQK